MELNNHSSSISDLVLHDIALDYKRTVQQFIVNVPLDVVPALSNHL